MKNRMLQLLLCMTIISTGPLSAMNPDIGEEKGTPHICASCTSTELFQETRAQQQGGLFALPNDVLIQIVPKTLKDTLFVSLVCKKLYNVCQTPIIWSGFLEAPGFSNLSKPCLKNQFIEQYKQNNKFMGSDRAQRIKIEALISLINQSKQASSSSSLWLFEKDNRRFRMSIGGNHENLKNLPLHATLTFVWEPNEENIYGHFDGHVARFTFHNLIDYSTIQDLSSEDYKNLAAKALKNQVSDAKWYAYSFKIGEIKPLKN